MGSLALPASTDGSSQRKFEPCRVRGEWLRWPTPANPFATANGS